MIDFAEIGDDETWELFARDYLAEAGFVIEVPPGRGPDQGRDLIISEQLSGTLRTEKFSWLVSCKYFTVSDRSVGLNDETDILGRLAHHNADGFMGFYSTLPSASLVDRLREHQRTGRLRAYEVFDRKRIENRFYALGLSKLALRYFPKSYVKMRPLQRLIGEYIPLNCTICNKDVLAESIQRPYGANVVWSVPRNRDENRAYRNVYIVCKGDCDKKLEDRLWQQGYITQWEDLGDLTNPAIYLKNIMAYLNQLYRGDVPSTEAHEEMKKIYIALAQRTLREVTEEDADRLGNSILVEGL